MNRKRALSGVIAAGLAALILAVSLIAHTSAQNDAEVVAVMLDPADPLRERLGGLEYRGGIDIPRMGQNIGGLSALRWDEGSKRLLAITDDARWVWIDPVEADGRLTGIASIEVGNLVGLKGEALTGKEQGDSESLTRSVYGGWLIGFERDHRIWRYSALDQRPDNAPVDPDALLPDPQELLGELEDNNGIEALAGNEMVLIACAERAGSAAQPNCVAASQDGNRMSFLAEPPAELAGMGAVPTDVDEAMDGTLYILFRSYSPSQGNTASIVAIRGEGERRELAVLRPPLSVDNFEGLAVREEAGRTFLYIVSDDNFSEVQRTLLMKFEVMPQGN